MNNNGVMTALYGCVVKQAWLVVAMVLITWAVAVGHADPQDSIHSLRERKDNLVSEREYLRRKKQETLSQAHAITSQIITNQRKLDQAHYQLRNQQVALVRTREQLQYMSGDIERTRSQQQVVQKEAAVRIRRMYTHGRVSMLEMVLESKDIPSLMDNLYYKKRLVAKDEQTIRVLRRKEQELQSQLMAQRQAEQRLGTTITSIQTIRDDIHSQLAHDKKLRDRYWNDAKAYESAERELLAESRRLEREIVAMARAAAQNNATQVQGSGVLRWPLQGKITSGFGYRVHPIHRRRLMHTGLDISRPHGTPVAAADNGQVIFAGWRGGYGKVVMVNHGSQRGSNMVTLYAHLSRIRVGNGQSVTKGQTLGNVGSTGYSTGAHLHFEVRIDGRPVNPLGYL
ncbi:MAG: peptidoglycan DD-metalloendopeptidase family protein [Vampirovibrionales bacterium]